MNVSKTSALRRLKDNIPKVHGPELSGLVLRYIYYSMEIDLEKISRRMTGIFDMNS